MSQAGETTVVIKRPRRRMVIALLLLLVLGGVGALLYFVALPIWIHGKIVAALRDAGGGGVALRVDGVSPWRVAMSDLLVGDDSRFHVDAVDASFDLDSLRRGEVGVIHVEGAVFDLRVRDGVIDLGPLAGFKRGGDAPGSSSATAALPFQRLEVRRSAIIFDWQGVRLHVPIECTITNDGPGRIGLDVTATVLDQPLRVHGTLASPTTQPSGVASAWDVDLSVEPLKWDAMGVRASMKSMTIKGTASPGGPTPGVDLRVTLAGGAFSSDGQELSEITAELPISSAGGQRGVFRVGSVVLGSPKLEAITGTIGVWGGRAEFSADWPAVASVKIGARGWLDSSLNGEVTAEVASFELAEATSLVDIVPALADLELGGKASAAASAKIVAGRVTPTVTVKTDDVKITDKRSGFSVAGISGDFTFDPRAPLASAGGQRFSAGRVSLGGDTVVNDVALRVGALSPTRVELLGFSLGKDQRFRIGAVDVGFDAETLRKGGVGAIHIDGASLDLRVRNGALDLGPLAAFAGASAATQPAARGAPDAGAKPRAFELPFQRLEVRKSAVVLDWEGVRLQLPIECTITKLDAGEIGVDITATILDLPVRLRGALAPPAAGVNAGAWGVNLKLDPLDWNGGGVHAAVATASITGKITPGGERGAGVELQVTVGGGAVSKDGQSLSEITATLPIVLNSGASTAGRFNIGKVVSGDRALPPVAGTIRVADGRAEFTADWALVKEAPIAAKGWIDSSLHAEATATVEPFDLREAKGLRELLPVLTELDLDGKFSMDAVVKMADGKTTPRVTLHVKDARFADKDAGLLIEGVDTDVTFTRFTTLGTRGGQKMTVKKLTLGDVSLLDGETSFQIERADSFLIEKTLWHWDDGGIMRFYDARIEPGKPIAVEVFLEDIGVERWIALLVNAIGGEAQKVEGEGKMNGRVPVTFSPGETEHPLVFGKGFLYANPGTGWYKLNDKTFISAMMQGINIESVSADAARFEEGLSNFEYTILTFEFIPVPDGLRGVLFAKGKNHNPEKPINFQGITANFNGLDQGLNEAAARMTSLTKLQNKITSLFRNAVNRRNP